MSGDRPFFEMKFDIGTLRHLGLQMYSTLPPVISELVSNAWDAEATKVWITIPETQLTDDSEITVRDNGIGMSEDAVRHAYLIVGRDRREEEKTDTVSEGRRRVMGRKGIGKFSAFGVAVEIEVETVSGGETSRFVMNFEEFKKVAGERMIRMPPLEPSGKISEGTLVTLRNIRKYRTRRINIQSLRRGLARRFAVIGPEHDFEVFVNGVPISPEERDLQALLETRPSGERFIWTYDDVEIVEGTGWRVSGWIGATDRKTTLPEGVSHGIAVMARGKLVQDPFVFDAVVGQQFALSYLIGELHAEFVDDAEDTVGTTRSSLVWDTDTNRAFLEWGRREVNRIAREWAGWRADDNEIELRANPLYQRFRKEAEASQDRGTYKVADKLIRSVIKKDVVGGPEEQKAVIELCLDFVQFDSFHDLAAQVTDAELEDVPKLIRLFREWEVLEAKEMARVTNGRITTIRKLQKLVQENALEVPTLHSFLKEFPWVIDPRWSLVADEMRFSELLRQRFPDETMPVQERRIDFLCVREGDVLVVVEIKRPGVKASMKELAQITEYVNFMRHFTQKTTAPDFKVREVVGYLLCGDMVDTYQVSGQRKILANSGIFVRLYRDLLQQVTDLHSEFLERYDRLRALRVDEEAGRRALPPAHAAETPVLSPRVPVARKRLS